MAVTTHREANHAAALVQAVVHAEPVRCAGILRRLGVGPDTVVHKYAPAEFRFIGRLHRDWGFVLTKDGLMVSASIGRKAVELYTSKVEWPSWAQRCAEADTIYAVPAEGMHRPRPRPIRPPHIKVRLRAFKDAKMADSAPGSPGWAELMRRVEAACADGVYRLAFAPLPAEPHAAWGALLHTQGRLTQLMRSLSEARQAALCGDVDVLHHVRALRDQVEAVERWLSTTKEDEHGGDGQAS